VKPGPLTLRVSAIALLALFVAFLLFTVRAHVAAKHELDAARVILESEGDPIFALRSAARWDAPFNASADEAFFALTRIAEDAEREGDLAKAKRAWRAVRSASVSARGLVELHSEVRRRADRHLADLAVKERVLGSETSQPESERAEAHLIELEEAANVGHGIADVAAFSFLVFVLALGFFASRGLDGDGKMRPRVGVSSLVVVATSGLLTVLCLAFA
jgi:hypothetical protein